MMAESTKTKAGKSSGTTSYQEFLRVSGRITNQKLDGNNYLQLQWVTEIYVAGREKISHLLAEPS